MRQKKRNNKKKKRNTKISRGSHRMTAKLTLPHTTAAHSRGHNRNREVLIIPPAGLGGLLGDGPWGRFWMVCDMGGHTGMRVIGERVRLSLVTRTRSQGRGVEDDTILKNQLNIFPCFRGIALPGNSGGNHIHCNRPAGIPPAMPRTGPLQGSALSVRLPAVGLWGYLVGSSGVSSFQLFLS